MKSKWVGRLVRVDCNDPTFPRIKDDFKGSLDVRLLFERVGFADDTRPGRAEIVPEELLESLEELLGFDDEDVEDKREDLRGTVDLSGFCGRAPCPGPACACDRASNKRECLCVVLDSRRLGLCSEACNNPLCKAMRGSLTRQRLDESACDHLLYDAAANSTKSSTYVSSPHFSRKGHPSPSPRQPFQDGGPCASSVGFYDLLCARLARRGSLRFERSLCVYTC